jgi:hypothetical protein
MKQLISIFVIALTASTLFAQNFELLDKQEVFQSGSVQKLKIPLRLKNISDKSQTLILQRVNEVGHPSKGYFCLNGNCADFGLNEYSIVLEAGEVQSLYYQLETGIITGQLTLKFEFFQKGNQKDVLEHTVTINVEDKPKPFIFQSKEISINDVYPNPASDQAYIEYKIHNDNVKAKLLIHNILGRILGDYQLASSETKIKIPTEDLPTGVYFYTLYIDQEAVLTRKLVVRK